jgi:hypothetical protein
VVEKPQVADWKRTLTVNAYTGGFQRAAAYTVRVSRAGEPWALILLAASAPEFGRGGSV